MTALHPEVMTASQRAVFEALGPFLRERGFYLVGGTAVAIHLGHRRSVDLDWFTGEALPDPLRLAEALRREIGGLDVGSVAPGTLHAEAGGVLLSFLEYRYPLLRDPVEWERYGCRLASLEDLACMKLSAISSRG
ncbi:MAG TPA: nucleotidyl transferase AbiEii/AbiGii toxin family protein, partial [Longimicrobiales bacterium]|nr:nucleotidyl transferase AbiEii/AbiGii toxin family protein [Longimicrobiales bacterium]